ncbi:DUF732 domain-containing protein [Actinomycetospora sp. CA-084318]|uniref:DUF732 domain-containing protein n=1 Tax=Actinomycetospora sp. CA-084318 TaxID=3239892 RepID=UPI003D9862EB
MTVPKAIVAALSTAGLATALLAGCSSSDQPPAQPSNADLIPTSVAPLPDSTKAQVFQNTLAQRSLSIPAPAAVAGQVCAGFDRNDPAPAIVADVQQLTGLDAGNAAYVLGASVSVYCPQSLDKLRQSVG